MAFVHGRKCVIFVKYLPRFKGFDAILMVVKSNEIDFHGLSIGYNNPYG
jgi:hypothetical protein